jgi:hypothetical protein
MDEDRGAVGSMAVRDRLLAYWVRALVSLLFVVPQRAVER